MNREFTKREKIILVVIAYILIGIVYYFFFFVPNETEIDKYSSLITSEQSAIDTVHIKSAQMKKMTSYLETVKETTQVMPVYSNLTNVYRALYEILEDTKYNLSFSNVTENGYIAKRTVGISYTADSYETARMIIDRIYNCEYLLQISNVSFSVGSPCSVSLTVTFYEVIDN